MYFTRMTPRIIDPLMTVSGSAAEMGHRIITGQIGSIESVDGARPYLYRAVGESAAQGYIAYTRERPRASDGWDIDDLDMSHITGLRNTREVEFTIRVCATCSSAGQPGKRGDKHCIVMSARRHYARTREPGDIPSLNEIAQDLVPHWLAPRLTELGLQATPETIEVVEHRQLVISRKGMTFWATDVFGHGRIVDSKKLRHSLLVGLGRAKSVGCGMLLVKT